MRQKNVSKIVPFRSLKRYLPCRLFPVFSSNTVRFSPRYRSVSFRFVSFRFVSFVRLHNGARTRWRFSERGLRPLLEKASRGFCSSPGGCQSIPTWLRGDRRSSEAAFLRRIRAPLDCARFSAECTERYRTKRNETKRNGTVCERFGTSFGNVALWFRAHFC